MPTLEYIVERTSDEIVLEAMQDLIEKRNSSKGETGIIWRFCTKTFKNLTYAIVHQNVLQKLINEGIDSVCEDVKTQYGITDFRSHLKGIIKQTNEKVRERSG
jgi:hypothetical protein